MTQKQLKCCKCWKDAYPWTRRGATQPKRSVLLCAAVARCSRPSWAGFLQYVSSSIDQNASTAVHSFLVILSLPGNDIARRTAAVLLRKHLSRQFQRLSSEVQEEARSSLLRVMRNEQDQMLALKIAAAVAAVVSEHGAEAWPGVPADLVAMITPNEEKSVCKGCQVLHVVLEDAYAPFASALGNEALDGLARRLLHLVDAADERTALAAHRALMELASRSQEAPIPALVEAAPRLLQVRWIAIKLEGECALGSVAGSAATYFLTRFTRPSFTRSGRGRPSRRRRESLGTARTAWRLLPPSSAPSHRSPWSIRDACSRRSA